jgi:hypothetical protein
VIILHFKEYSVIDNITYNLGQCRRSLVIHYKKQEYQYSWDIDQFFTLFILLDYF